MRRVRFQHAGFEDAEIEKAVFDVVVAATSWHWVGPAPLAPGRHTYDPIDELRASDCFDSIERHEFPFEVSYSADFLTLLYTYASHDVIDSTRRSRLYDRLREVIQDELGGSVVKPYRVLLALGRNRV